MNKINNILNSLNSNDVKYCVWKGPSKLESVKVGLEDLDILLDRKNFDLTVMLIKNAGFTQVTNIKEKLDYGTFDFICLDTQSRWLHIHLHLYIIFGNSIVRNYYLPLDAEILSNRVFNERNNCWNINPSHDIALSLIRYLVRRRPLYGYVDMSNDFMLLKDIYKDYNIDVGILKSKIFTPNLLAMMNKFNTLSLDEVYSNRKAIKKSIVFYKMPVNIKYFLNYIFVLFILSWRKVMHRKGSKVLSNRGLVIAFVGIDGSGKSSAIERLSNALAKQLIVTTISVGSGVSGSSWYRKLAFKIFGTKAKFKGHAKIRKHNINSKPISYPWYYNLWLFLCLFDKKRELKRGLQAANKGHVVLSDRWLQSEQQGFIDSPRFNGRIPTSWLSKKLCNYESAIFNITQQNIPDIIVRFDVSPENSVLRKPNDLNYEQASFAGEKLKTLVWSGAKVVSIDANKKIEDVDKQLVLLINNELKSN